MHDRSRESERANELHRVRAKTYRRSTSRKRPDRVRSAGPDVLVLLIFVAATILLLNPFGGLRFRGNILAEVLQVLISRQVTLASGLVLLILATIVGLMRLRWRINHSKRFRKSDCPACGGGDLRRTPRKPYQRRLEQFGVPVRRYICADCHWRGGLIDPQRVD